MLKRKSNHGRPSKILSVKNLSETWHTSRDSGQNAGAAGVDGVKARRYAANLSSNIATLSERIRLDQFGFAKLRAVTIPKSNSNKDRVICIPTVEDRLVQRTLSTYLHKRRLLPIYNDSSFGFLPGKGVSKALEQVLQLRREHQFVFETDISAFFDNVDRNLLIERLRRSLGRSNALNLLENAVRCEIKPSIDCSEEKLTLQGIVRGKGIRQGMPLSPLFANAALSDFDKHLLKNKVKLIRYADDLIVFANSKQQALEHGKLVEETLMTQGLAIPSLSEDGKTKVAGKMEPFEFLGREIYFSQRWGDYQQGVSNGKIQKIIDSIIELSQIETAIENKKQFHEIIAVINQKIESYRYSYSDAANSSALDQRLNETRAVAINTMFSSMFGEDATRALTPEHKRFLGIKQDSKHEIELDYF